MKDEHYVDYKHARGIYARDEAAKITFGPWFKAIEDVLYAEPEFIKHVPVKDRAKYIMEKLYIDGGSYVATDYSSFEAHFSKEIMQNCEFLLYEHMLGTVDGGTEVLKLMEEVLQGENIIVNKYVSARITARRMSGEMNTSLGNGFSNLMFMGYVCEQLGLKVRGVVEGDDGLFAFFGRRPHSADFAQYGFKIKLDCYEDLSIAGFCGNIFDIQDQTIITDPYKVLSLFGWTTTRYRSAKNSKLMSLLRCKSLSLAHQYPGCPIISALAQYGLRATKSFDVRGVINARGIDLYTREKYQEAFKWFNSCSHKDKVLRVEPGIQTRLLFEETYKISVEEQRTIEAYLDNLNSIAPLKIDQITEQCPPSWRNYFERYTLPKSIVEKDGTYLHENIRE
jgi:hypothetical protein